MHIIEKVITIGFSKPKKKFPIFSWLIRLFEGTKYSHVYLSWHSNIGFDIVYEASGTSLKFLNKKLFDKKAETIYTFNFVITIEEYRKLIKFCMENAGVDYGIKQIIGIILVRIFGLKKNPFSDGRASQVCSETVAYFLQDILGRELPFDKDIVGPKTLYKYLTNLNKEN